MLFSVQTSNDSSARSRCEEGLNPTSSTESRTEPSSLKRASFADVLVWQFNHSVPHYRDSSLLSKAPGDRSCCDVHGKSSNACPLTHAQNSTPMHQPESMPYASPITFCPLSVDNTDPFCCTHPHSREDKLLDLTGRLWLCWPDQQQLADWIRPQGL